MVSLSRAEVPQVHYTVLMRDPKALYRYDMILTGFSLCMIRNHNQTRRLYIKLSLCLRRRLDGRILKTRTRNSGEYVPLARLSSSCRLTRQHLHVDKIHSSAAEICKRKGALRGQRTSATTPSENSSRRRQRAESHNHLVR